MKSFVHFAHTHEYIYDIFSRIYIILPSIQDILPCLYGLFDFVLICKYDSFSLKCFRIGWLECECHLNILYSEIFFVYLYVYQGSINENITSIKGTLLRTIIE
jgi:hypothetical protein